MDLEAVAAEVGRVVGRGRGFGVHRSAGRIQIVIETLSDDEQRRIEEAVGEPIDVHRGRGPRRMMQGHLVEIRKSPGAQPGAS